MNDTAWQTGGELINGGPAWLTLSFVLIGLGVLLALFILAWGARLAKRRQKARQALEARGELSQRTEAAPALVPAAVAPSPPPLADAPLPASPPVEAEPAAEPDRLADEPIAAAAPLDASPASLAVSEPAIEHAAGADELTRMKGVGPKLAERLNALGITRFAQLAALSPAEAEALDAQLGNFQGRIHRDRWIEQAGFLARGDQAGYEAVFGRL